MKYFLLVLTVLMISACMKSKDEYQEAISDVQEQQAIEREEAEDRNEQRSRGSNDAEGMGMDE